MKTIKKEPNIFWLKTLEVIKKLFIIFIETIKENKNYLLWFACYVIVLVPLYIISFWYQTNKVNEEFELSVWFSILTVYFIITILFIRPIIKYDK